MPPRLLIALAVLLLLVSGRASGATMCPWLTQGSAAKILGGDVSVSVISANETEGSCTFSRRQGAAVYLFEVSVHKAAGTGCPADGTKLRGIGNEAILCRMERSPSETVEEVSGRVRDLYFSVSLGIHGPKSSAMTIEAQREGVNQAAEQVAGNLF